MWTAMAWEEKNKTIVKKQSKPALFLYQNNILLLALLQFYDYFYR